MERDPNRFLKILEAPGSVENYLLFRVDGREMLSTPFEFRLTLRSQGEIPSTREWIGASVSFVIGLSDRAGRKINGQCVRFEHAYQKGAYVEFILDIAPSFLVTRLRRDCRIFTKVTAKQVIHTILQEHSIVFDDSKIKAVSEVRDYCVQYNESDFDFVNRLMEEEGIFYFFRYDENAGAFKHKMYLADDPSGYFDGEIYKLSFRRDHLLRGLQSIEMSNDATTAAWVTHDYDFRKPRNLQPVTTPTRLNWATPNTRVYDWPGGHTTQEGGRRRAGLAMEETEAAAVLLEGVGSYVCFTPGARFEIDDPRLKPRERRITVRSVVHSAWDPAGLEEGEPSYQQQFTAIPSYQPYRTPRITPPAVVRGPQTAVVVDHDDPEGFGRVKVAFHWNRDRDETCWVRVAHQWAGPTYGAQFVPRVGMEVLVAFLEGDPDRPLVVGCLYNGDNKQPFETPAKLSQAGWRTSSYPDGGVVNELIFEDKKGEEEIYAFAGRNYRRVTTKDEEFTVGGQRTTTIGKNDALQVGQDVKTTVGGDVTVAIAGALGVTVGQSSDFKSAGSFTFTAGQSLTLQAGGARIQLSPAGVSINGVLVRINS